MHLLQLSTLVPRHKYSTKEMMELFPQELPDEVQQNILNLGVSTRYFAQPIDFSSNIAPAPNDLEPAVHVGALTCKQALENLGLQPANIDYLIATYDSSAFLCPGVSNLLLSKIGLNPTIKHVSIQGMACSAFARSLQLAEDHLTKFPRSYVMISLSGVNSYWFYNQVRGLKDVKGIHEIRALQDISLRSRELRKWIALIEFFLFGDGSSCAIVSDQGDGPQIRDIVSITNMGQSDYLAGYSKLTPLSGPFKFGFYSHLEKDLPEFGVKYTSTILERLLYRRPRSFKMQVKKWIVHTGSKRILDHIAASHGITYEKVKESYDILAKYGNLAGASLPFILDEIMREGGLGKDDYAIMLGYGWGFSATAGIIVF